MVFVTHVTRSHLVWFYITVDAVTFRCLSLAGNQLRWVKDINNSWYCCRLKSVTEIVEKHDIFEMFRTNCTVLVQVFRSFIQEVPTSDIYCPAFCTEIKNKCTLTTPFITQTHNIFSNSTVTSQFHLLYKSWCNILQWNETNRTAEDTWKCCALSYLFRYESKFRRYLNTVCYNTLKLIRNFLITRVISKFKCKI